MDVLTSEGVSRITWSPDDIKVIYIEENKSEENGLSEAYLWKVGEEKAAVVRVVSQETYSFTWASGSQYFLISEKQGEKFVNSIVNADNLFEEEYKIKSTSIPVWNPDGLSLVFSDEQNDYGEGWGSLEVYTIGEKKSEYIWKAKDTLYEIESWDQEGNIAYTEVYEGKETKKTTQNIRPAISGVHLGDTKEEVRTALGTDYEETPPSAEVGHFPEQVYRWTYDKGFTIFVGEESGKVLEILATSPEAETNLGVKIGDTAAKVFEAYRQKYIEPESIHGGKLFGVFKVEGAAALSFNFTMGEEEVQFPREIKPESKVEMMILTYPEQMDDSF